MNLENKIINDKYIFTNYYFLDSLILTNIIKDFEDEEYFLCSFLNKELIENKNALENYDVYKNKFNNSIAFFKKFNLKPFPKILDSFIENQQEFFLFKKFHGKNIDQFLKERKKNFTYKEAYELSKNLFLSLSIAEKNNVFFDLEKHICINNDNLLLVNFPFTIKNNIIKDSTIIQMTDLFYKLITGVSYFENLKSLTDLNIIIPNELEYFLMSILNGEKNFNSLENFINQLNDKIIFTTVSDNNNISNIKISQSNKKNNLGCLFSLLLFLLIFSFSLWGITKFVSNIKNNIITDIFNFGGNTPETIPDSGDLNILDFFDVESGYNLDFETTTYTGTFLEDNGFLYYNIFSTENNSYDLYKENILTNEKNIIYKDIILKYMTIYKDTIYFSNGNDEFKIYSINIDGTNLKKLTENINSAYLQIDSTGSFLYYVTGNLENRIINKLFLENNKDEIYKTKLEDASEYYLYLDMYNVFRNDYIDNFKQLQIEYYPYSKNYSSYKSILLFVVEGQDFSQISAIDKNGNLSVFPFQINATKFFIKNDSIYYIEYETFNLKKFNLITKKDSIIKENCSDILYASDKIIFAIENSDKTTKIFRLDFNELDNSYEVIENYKNYKN